MGIKRPDPRTTLTYEQSTENLKMSQSCNNNDDDNNKTSERTNERVRGREKEQGYERARE